MEIEGYRIEKTLLKSGQLRFQIASRNAEKEKFLLKTILKKEAKNDLKAQLAYEFEVARKADSLPGVLSPNALVQNSDLMGLVYAGGDLFPLSTCLDSLEDRVLFALNLGIELSQIIFRLHKSGYTHHEINPDTIWVNPDKQIVKLMGPGISPAAGRVVNQDVFDTKDYWLYKSPEQVGRLNEKADRRTDFYSLGAVLFTAIVGRPPFDGIDSFEVIHNHIAKSVPNLERIVPQVPAVLSDIISKLMAKSADDRYQQSASIMVDLKRCLDAFKINKTVPRFRLDVLCDSNLFVYPGEVYGRRKEMNHLSACLDKVIGGAGYLTMVSGESGVGKTSLIKSFERSLPVDKGYFAVGKYEPIASTIPYSGILKALGQIARLILMETDDAYQKIRNRLVSALGDNVGVTTNFIPQFEPILGQVPFFSNVTVIESRSRLHKCIKTIIDVLCEPKEFVVIFLDDLQWVDQASLELIKSIAGSHGLYLIGAYRDNEVSSTHILKNALEKIEKKNIAVNTLSLSGLGLKTIEEIFKDALNLKERESTILAGIVHKKTGGNPIVTKEFVELLVKKKFICLNDRMEWAWHLDEIERIDINPDLDALARQKLNGLGKESGHTISVAAVIGSVFHEEELTIQKEMSQEQIRTHLNAACAKNILISRGKGLYQFEHDRLQENAYKMIPEHEKDQIHLRLGKSIAKREYQDKNRIFRHITHLNFAHRLINAKKEKIQLARLNLAAGKQAKDVAAFSESYRYFVTGIHILGDRAWEKSYALTLELYFQASILAFLSGSFDESERMSQAIIQNGGTDIDRTLGYESQIECAIFQDKPDKAVRTLLHALNRLGVSMPSPVSREEVVQETLKLKKIAYLILEIPWSQVSPMTDTKFKTVMRLLVYGVRATGWHDYLYYWVFVGKMLKISQEHGFTDESAFGLVAAGGAFCHLLEEYSLGRKVAEYGLEYLEKNNRARWLLDAQAYFHEEITCLISPPKVTIKKLTQVYYKSIESGNIMTAIESAHAACLTGLYGSMDLSELKRLVAKFDEIISFSLPGIKSLQSNLKMISNIVQGLSAPLEPKETMEEFGLEKSVVTKELPINIRLFLNIVFRRKEAAAKDAEELLKYGNNYIMIPTVFYSLLGLQAKAGCGDYMAILDELYGRLKRRSDFCQETFAHRQHLVLAEKYRLQKQMDAALLHYEKAIFTAKEKGFIVDQAIAWELAAEFFKELGVEQLSKIYLKEAFVAYEKWGAGSKLCQIQRSHSFLSDGLSADPGTQPSNVSHDSNSIMDRSSINRAIVTLVSAEDGETLLQRLMLILLQNSGAERGYLLSLRKEKIVVECHVSIEEEAVRLTSGTPIEKYDSISHSIARYVCRTNNRVLASDISKDVQFSNTAYVRETGLKSVLCMPIAYQNKTVAFIYLENHQVKNTLSEKRFHIIQLLSNQIAAAIERNRLNRELIQEIENRKNKERELQVTVKRLNKLKNSLNEENQYLKEEIRNTHGFKDIIGNSAALKKTLYLVKQVISFDTTTLILGESGTGKELIARGIHELSPRKDRPMVKVNCAALPATLIESELFGYEKGAFTGAVKSQKGRFLMADGGTLFLDEIGDMPVEVQVKLLRVLQEGTFEPLGSDETVKVDVRVVAATNKDLEQSILKGEFREDLYYRLSIFPIKVPALRERTEDIPLLVRYLIDKKNKQLNKNIKQVSTQVMKALTDYDWPGNIRELENFIERAMILSQGASLTIDHSFNGVSTVPKPLSDTSFDKAMAAHIVHVLSMCGWKIKGKGNAAERLGLNPSTLRSKMVKLGIRPE
ncbi:sigma 54-interacting transcriptional regulator [Desulforhopalus singaporensis]|uniref:Transcriptional regulator containing GAF, AAA-type ATPase, and DNA binding domains n=1 Tax=Desulforhopalus singaporensis TaxID=91360 RepID=A0A1H0T6B3_9BACT|nr:sigma 54-interacting transcriptional regulator [Desulforhopalus singaporensis]SDP49351.1 Transcriptional regulator containing GAF, AAA-type ATPase, and DNA binding domains [Desulforhopalus singaporensis]